VTQEFKNDNLSAIVEKLPNCQAKFKVNLTPAYAKELKLKAAKSVSKEVAIPGFRKGKAPEDIIAKQYGKYIDQEFKEIAVKAAYVDTAGLSKIFPLQQNSGIDLQKFTPAQDGSVEITYQYEIFPEVKDVELDSIKIEPVASEPITQAQIDQTIREIQLYHADWKVIEDRPVQEGDFVVVDIDVLGDHPFKAYENSRFQVKEKWMPEWARKLVLGLKINESAEGLSENEKNEVNFEPRTCRITVNMIQEANLPELSDELAKKAGANTADDLMTNIKKQLEFAQKKDIQQKLRDQVKAILIENNSLDIPQSDLKNLEEDCRKMVDQDKDFFKSPQEMQDYKAKLFENGKGVLKLAYLLPHISGQLNLPMPSEQEIQQRLIEILTQHYMQTRQTVEEKDIQMLQQKIKRDLIHENVLDKLIEKNLTPAS
jgi:trigger factor